VQLERVAQGIIPAAKRVDPFVDDWGEIEIAEVEMTKHLTNTMAHALLAIGAALDLFIDRRQHCVSEAEHDAFTAECRSEDQAIWRVMSSVKELRADVQANNDIPIAHSDALHRAHVTNLRARAMAVPHPIYRPDDVELQAVREAAHEAHICADQLTKDLRAHVLARAGPQLLTTHQHAVSSRIPHNSLAAAFAPH